MSFNKHAKYKDSGLPLTPMVPSHWERTALKYLGDYQNGYPFKPEDRGEEGLPIIRISQLTSDDEPAYFDGELDDRVKVFTGDLLLSWSATIDSFIWNRGYAWLNQHIFKVTESREAHKGFLYYVIKHIAPKLAEFDAHGSTMRHIKKESLGERLYIPPMDEQLAIASFLDRETAKIDALIAEQQRLIELLQEKRQAVISHAVAKGLNPNASMKDSGVEWLGEVPEHWEILPIWILFQLGRGRVISHEDIAQNPGDYPVYSSQTEDNGEMGRIGTFDFEGEYLTWTTDGANAGSVFRREGRFNCTNVCGTLKAKSSTHINLDFALASLRLATRTFVRMDINPKLMNNVMASIRVPVPPMGEQVEIIRKLDKQIRGFRPLEDSIEVQVCLLKERRSALISAAVTGQIDVRGLVEAEAGEQ